MVEFSHERRGMREKGQTFTIHSQQTIWTALPFVYTLLSNAWTTRALRLSLESQTEANHAKLHTTGPQVFLSV